MDQSHSGESFEEDDEVGLPWTGRMLLKLIRQYTSLCTIELSSTFTFVLFGQGGLLCFVAVL